MLNVDPVDPGWGPMCPQSLGYCRFGGRWGPFRQLGSGSACYGPNRQKTVLAVTQCNRGFLGKALAHRNRVCVVQLSYNRGFRWFGHLGPQFAIYWVLGVGDIKILPPRWGPKTGQKREKVDFPGLGGRSGGNTRRPNLIAC